MVQIILSPEYDLSRRLEKIERTLSGIPRNPIAHTSATSSQSDFSIDASPAPLGQQSIVVPDGYTSCRASIGVSVAAVNSAVANGTLYVAASVNGIGGTETQAWASSNTLTSASAMTTRTLTDLTSGQTLTVEALVRTNSGAWAGNAANTVRLSAIFLFGA